VTGAWERFLFRPVSVAPLVLVRIAYGFLLIVWTAALAPDLTTFFSTSGVLPSAGHGAAGAWSLFALTDSPWALWAGWALLLCAAGALLVGWRTNVAALLAFVLITSFERRNYAVFNAGDGLVRMLALYLALSHAGAAVSLDSRRAGRSRWEIVERAPWALRLMQMQLSLIYVAAVADKLGGTTWRHGTALAYALQLDDLHRFPLPGAFSTQPVLVGLLTFGTLAVESAMAVCVWIPRVRLPVMIAGIALHVGIAYAMRVGFFSAMMLTFYLAFVPPERAEALVRLLRHRSIHEKRPLSPRTG
jgi:Vitamin K-dependent gamma-carboxylase